VRNETLSEIAVRIRGNSNMRLHEIVRELVALNPEATKGREDFVAEGAVLRVPQQLASVNAAPVATTPTAPSTAVPAESPAQPLARLRMSTSLDSLNRSPELATPVAVPAPAAAPVPSTATASESDQTSQPMAQPRSEAAQPATASEAAPAATADQAASPAGSEPSTATQAETAATSPTSDASEERMQPGYIPALKAEAKPAQVEPAKTVPGRHGYGGWLTAILGLLTVVLLWWARREEAFNRAAQEARVVAAKEQSPDASTQSPGMPSAASAGKRAAQVASDDRAALLKQAYAARGKRFNDVRKG
jgi:cobalamin biosynthesis Mg chelatase CobN